MASEPWTLSIEQIAPEWTLSGPGQMPEEGLTLAYYPATSVRCEGGVRVEGGSPRRKKRTIKVLWWALSPKFVQRHVASPAEALAAFEARTGVAPPAGALARLDAHIEVLRTNTGRKS